MEVRKQDQTHRVCIDYRKLNKVTVFDPAPINQTEDLFNKVAKDRFFSKIDLSKGYWQIPVAEEDVHKTAFVTPDGTYEFLRMPFGMMNSSATLTRAMRILLDGLNNVESYIDDILVHTETWEEHLQIVKALFERLREWNLTIRPSKCVFGASKLDFIGHNIGEGKLCTQEENVIKIINAPRPKTKTAIRSFIGLTGYYRSFISNYATIAAPLTDLTKKGKPNMIEWGPAQEKAYATLKQLLASKPILKLPEFDKTFILRTDASQEGVGAILLQKSDSELFPIAYASKKLASREKSYCTMERECLAIVWAVKRFMMYLYGKEFILQTDHQPLIYLHRAKFDNDRIMRWAMYLQNFKIRIEAIKGTLNVGADYLSRAF